MAWQDQSRSLAEHDAGCILRGQLPQRQVADAAGHCCQSTQLRHHQYVTIKAQLCTSTGFGASSLVEWPAVWQHRTQKAQDDV